MARNVQLHGRNQDPQGSLMAETKRMLKERSLMEVHHATGISFYWLRKFSSGETTDPSVNRVQRLYEYLSGKKLAV